MPFAIFFVLELHLLINNCIFCNGVRECNSDAIQAPNAIQTQLVVCCMLCLLGRPVWLVIPLKPEGAWKGGGRCFSPSPPRAPCLLPRSSGYWVDRLRFRHLFSFFSSSIDLSLTSAIPDEVTCRFGGLYNGSNGHGGGFSSGVLLCVLLASITRRTPEEHQKKKNEEHQKNPKGEEHPPVYTEGGGDSPT
jgi:hypothetical protein